MNDGVKSHGWSRRTSLPTGFKSSGMQFGFWKDVVFNVGLIA